MTRKVDYEFKTDKRGRNYANQIVVKTGKRKRISVKLAKKRLRDIRYRENRRGKEKELKKKGSDWNKYQKEKRIVIEEKKKEYKAKGKKPKKEKIKKDIEKETLKRVGVRSRYRFNWKYWELPICNTPTFIADAQAFDGDHYKQMKQFCNDILDDIEQTELCPQKSIIGGACIVVYRRKDKKIIKMHELGDGCIKGIEKGM